MAQAFRFLLALLLLFACSGGTTAESSNVTTASPSPGNTTTPSPGNTTTPSPGNTTSPSPGNTTSPSPGNTTTPSPGNTTSPSPGNTTSPSPGNTTSPSPGNTTTPSPGNTTTPSPGNTTSPSPGNTTTPSPVTNTPPTTGTPATTPPPNPCSSQPCGRGATCENRGGEDFVCLCLPGDFYNNNTNSCEAAKVFPGELEIQNLPFDEALTDKTSERFKNASANVTRDIKVAFTGNDAYLTSTVLEFRQRTRSSRQAEAAIASVQIIFDQTASINKDGVVNQLNNCNDCTTLGNVNFTATGLCSSIPCDVTTTTCEDGDDGNYTCSCLDGFFTTTFTNDRMCIACPSGQQFVDNECIDCPLGYSGFNCGENWELLLLIVGPVLGGLLLITLILLITVAVRSKKHRKASSTADIGTPFISHQSTKAPLINGSKGVPAVAGVPSIPRATAHNSPYSSTNLEMIPSNSQQNLITNGRNSRHHEDYGQSRPQNNPYSQIRPVSSSYTPNQGIVNPYYKNDSR